MGTSELTDLLNDLIRINGDRVEGYEKAVKELGTEDDSLKSILEKNAKQSRQYYGDLSSLVVSEGGAPSSGTTTAGKVYRMWMDIRAGVSSHEKKSVLASCEFGEDAAQRAYEEALNSEVDIPDHVRDVILSEKSSLQEAHDQLKTLIKQTQSN